MVLHINVQGKIKKTLKILKKKHSKTCFIEKQKNLLKTVFTTIGLPILL